MSRPSLGSTTEGKSIPIDVDRLIETRAVILSASGGGKSWALRRILEQTHGQVQQIVIDVEDEFATLREKYDYVLAGRQGGDCPADVRCAGLLARRLLELRASAIVGIYELKQHDRIRFVRLFLEELVNAPKELWHPVLVVIDEAQVFCLSDDTEVLTRGGWRRWDKVAVGDTAVCYDPDTKAYSYGQIQRLIARNFDGEVIRARSDGVDALMTPDHRAVIHRIQRAKGRYQVYPPVFCEAERLTSHFYIPKGGGVIGAGIPDLSLPMCELLGWIITDGCFTGGAKRRYLSITQSTATTKMGASMHATLSALLSSLGSTKRYDLPAETSTRKGKVWNKADSSDFYLGVDLSQKALAYLGDTIHRIPRRVLEDADRPQLEALLLGLLRGNGTAHSKRWVRFYAGLSQGMADDFQELCMKLGISCVNQNVPQNGQWAVALSQRKWHYIRKTTREPYAGIVWDITVPTGAFVARRSGKAFVTGNCPEAGKAESTQAVIDLMTRGRKRGFCGVLASQRASMLSKDASAQAINKLIGRFSQDIDVKRAADDLGFYRREQQADLRSLKPGTFFAVGPAFCDAVTEVVVGPVTTTHPRAGQRALAPPPPKESVKRILATLADLPHEAEQEAQTVGDLKRRIRELEALLSQRERAS